jgi:hypothetical protein
VYCPQEDQAEVEWMWRSVEVERPRSRQAKVLFRLSRWILKLSGMMTHLGFEKKNIIWDPR